MIENEKMEFLKTCRMTLRAILVAFLMIFSRTKTNFFLKNTFKELTFLQDQLVKKSELLKYDFSGTNRSINGIFPRTI